MKTEMRRELARQPFEEKIRKVGQLIRLSRKIKGQRIREDVEDFPQSGWSLPAAAGDSQSIQLSPKNSRK